MLNVLGDKQFEDFVAAWVVRHTVGFAHNTADRVIAGGSGVLVRCGKIGGILTCAHVLDDILGHANRKPDGQIGIIANGPSDQKNQCINMKLVEFKALPMIVKRAAGEPALGPDLGFVALPTNTMSALEAIGSALDLDRQKIMRSPKPHPDVTHHQTLAAGNWAELVTMIEHSAFTKVASFTTAVVSGDGEREAPHDGYDRFRLTVHPMETYPQSYEGLSGGGVWILGFKLNDDRATLVERRLVGIAYYQTGAEHPSQRSILLHGPTSLYDRLLPEIEALSVTP